MDKTSSDWLGDRLSRKQAAEFLGVKPETISALHSRGKLPLSRYRVCGRTYYSKSELLEFIEGCKIPASAA